MSGPSTKSGVTKTISKAKASSFRDGKGHRGKRGGRKAPLTSREKNLYKRARAKRPCFKCGEVGHSKIACPNGYPDSADIKCFGCRELGHSLRNCPFAAQIEHDTPASNQRICFNCGKSGHASRNCSEPWKNGGASFATCFVCKEIGHLSKNCKKENARGIYPDGGCCRKCQSVSHLAKDCDVLISDDVESASSKKQKKNESDKAKSVHGRVVTF